MRAPEVLRDFRCRILYFLLLYFVARGANSLSQSSHLPTLSVTNQNTQKAIENATEEACGSVFAFEADESFFTLFSIVFCLFSIVIDSVNT